MNLCDHKDWPLTGIQEHRYSVCARNLCFLAWRLGAELEEPRVLAGTQAQMWCVGKRDEPGLQPASLDLWMGALSAFSPDNHGSSTERQCSHRAMQKGPQPGSRAELSTLSRKNSANPGLSVFSKGGTRHQGGKSLDQNYTTENNEGKT